MTVSVQQPYFFPYIGYFSMIKHTDIFIACDEVQHIKQGWVHRNRIISLEKDFNYIHTVMQKAHQSDLIKNIRIVPDPGWKTLLLNHLTIYKKRAPHYRQVVDVVNACLDYGELSLAKWNVHSLQVVCDYLGIGNDIRILSEMDIPYELAAASDEWGLNVTYALGAKTYRNLPGGKSFYDKEKYTAKGVDLQFITNNLRPYYQ